MPKGLRRASPRTSRAQETSKSLARIVWSVFGLTLFFQVTISVLSLPRVVQELLHIALFAASLGAVKLLAERQLQETIFVRLSRLIGVDSAARHSVPSFILKWRLPSQKQEAEAQTKADKVTVERRGREAYVNLHDEISEIESAVERESQSRQRYERLFVDLFEISPCPLLAFSDEGAVFHANTAFLQMYDVTPSDIHGWRGEKISQILSEKLGAAAGFVKRVEQIVGYSAPRLMGKDFDFKVKGENRLFRVSVSTLVYETKRILVIAFEEDKTSVFSAGTLREVLSEVALAQLKSVQRLSHALGSNVSESVASTVTNECETLLDHVNMLFDISTGNSAGHAKPQVEFNLVNFFKNLVERFGSQQRIEFSLSKNIPLYVCGDPAKLRQCIKVAAEAYFEVNPKCALRIQLGTSSDNGDVVVTFCSSEGPVARNNEMQSLLEKMSKFFRFQIASSNHENEPNVFLRFSFPLIRSSLRQTQLRMDLGAKLLQKNILFLRTASELDFDASTLLGKLEAQNKEVCGVQEIDFVRIKQNVWDAIVIFAHSSLWQKDAHVHRIAERARRENVPVAILTSVPRRGDSVAALEMGLSAYLARPLQQPEFEQLLMLLTDERVFEIIRARGIITRYSMQELNKRSERVLIADFFEQNHAPASALQSNLARFGFKIKRVATETEFFEELAKSQFDFVFYPSDIASSGLRRRLLLSLRRRRSLCYETKGEVYREGAEPVDIFAPEFKLNPRDPTEIIMAIEQLSLMSPGTNTEAMGRKLLVKGAA